MPTVIIPWRGGCRWRELALEWVLGRYRDTHPEWDVHVAEAPADGPWSKARAIVPALQAAPAGIVIVADADVWCGELPEAVAHVEAGAPWAIPHGHVFRLSARCTSAVLKGAPPAQQSVEQPPYVGMEGGGYVIAPRDRLLEIPPDPRFEGWGGEDLSWAMALHWLAGPAWRGAAPLWHLWHPPQQRRDRSRGSEANHQLMRRYARARYEDGELRRLAEEAHAALRAPQDPVHDHPKV